MKIYVGNLSYQVSENELREAFEQYGEVISANIVQDKITGQSKGFGFVEMSNKEESQTAIDGVKEIKGREVRVSEAKPREDSGSRFGGQRRR
ncbi:MAG: RNA-binding protein [Oligoflexia bacterium]|nr:RNA-binding protein [Oligoflexia bacterium]